MFEGIRFINSVADKKATVSEKDLDTLKTLYHSIVFDVFGLKEEILEDNSELINGLMKIIIDIRLKARKNKDWETSDAIRDQLKELGIILKDSIDETTWTIQ